MLPSLARYPLLSNAKLEGFFYILELAAKTESGKSTLAPRDGVIPKSLICSGNENPDKPLPFNAATPKTKLMRRK